MKFDEFVKDDTENETITVPSIFEHTMKTQMSIYIMLSHSCNRIVCLGKHATKSFGRVRSSFVRLNRIFCSQYTSLYRVLFSFLRCQFPTFYKKVKCLVNGNNGFYVLSFDMKIVQFTFYCKLLGWKKYLFVLKNTYRYIYTFKRAVASMKKPMFLFSSPRMICA